MTFRQRLDRLETRALASRPQTLVEFLDQFPPDKQTVLIDIRERFGLPLPIGTPPEIARYGVLLFRQALVAKDFDEFHSWVKRQHAEHGTPV